MFLSLIIHIKLFKSNKIQKDDLMGSVFRPLLWFEGGDSIFIMKRTYPMGCLFLA